MREYRVFRSSVHFLSFTTTTTTKEKKEEEEEKKNNILFFLFRISSLASGPAWESTRPSFVRLCNFSSSSP